MGFVEVGIMDCMYLIMVWVLYWYVFLLYIFKEAKACFLVCIMFFFVSYALFELFPLSLLSCVSIYEWYRVFMGCFSFVPLLCTDACSGALQ